MVWYNRSRVVNTEVEHRPLICEAQSTVKCSDISHENIST